MHTSLGSHSLLHLLLLSCLAYFLSFQRYSRSEKVCFYVHGHEALHLFPSTSVHPSIHSNSSNSCVLSFAINHLALSSSSHLEEEIPAPRQRTQVAFTIPYVILHHLCHLPHHFCLYSQYYQAELAQALLCCGGIFLSTISHFMHLVSFNLQEAFPIPEFPKCGINDILSQIILH